MHESRQHAAVTLPDDRPTGVLTGNAAPGSQTSLTALLTRFPLAVLGRDG
jgi:hypothetical protein